MFALVLTGPPGAGKTSVLEALTDALSAEDVRHATVETLDDEQWPAPVDAICGLYRSIALAPTAVVAWWLRRSRLGRCASSSTVLSGSTRPGDVNGRVRAGRRSACTRLFVPCGPSWSGASSRTLRCCAGPRGALERPTGAREVDHARAYPRESMLVVVSEIELAIDSSGDPAPNGGILRYVLPWSPTDDELRAVAFHAQPDGSPGAGAAEARLPSDAWEDFVAAVAQHRRHIVENGDTAWATVSEALRHEGWELAPYQPGGASGAVLRRAINDAFARGLVPDDDSLVKRRRR